MNRKRLRHRESRRRRRKSAVVSLRSPLVMLRNNSFLVYFAGLWLFAIVGIAKFPLLTEVAIQATVRSVYWALRLAGMAGSMGTEYVKVGANYLFIVPDCTPLMPVALLSSAIIAYKCPLRWKMAGVLCGAICLSVFNVIRIILMILIESRIPSASEFMHAYLFQILTILVVFGIFIGWTWVQRRTA